MGFQLVQVSLERIMFLGAFQRRPTVTGRHVGMNEKPLHGLSKGCDVLLGNEQSRHFMDQPVGDATDGESDDRTSMMHSLQTDHPERLWPARRDGDDLGRAIEPIEIIVIDPSLKVHSFVESQPVTQGAKVGLGITRADDGSREGASDVSECPEEKIDAFASNELSHIEEAWLIGKGRWPKMLQANDGRHDVNLLFGKSILYQFLSHESTPYQ